MDSTVPPCPAWLHLPCGTVTTRPIREGCTGCGEHADHPGEIVAARADTRGPYRSRAGVRYAVVLDLVTADA